MAQNCFALIYMSAAAVQPSREQLMHLLQQSRRFNSEHGITGLLAYARGSWIEVLEGDRKSVEELMSRISRDQRHRDIDVVQKGPISAREFSDWSMAFLDFASPEVRALPGYSLFLEEPVDWGNPSKIGRSLQMLNYFKAIMLAPDDSVSNLVQSAEIQLQAPALAGKIAVARRKA